MTTAIDPLLRPSAAMARLVVRRAVSARPVVQVPSVRRVAVRPHSQVTLSAIIRRRLTVTLVAAVAFVSVFALWNSVVSADGDTTHSEVPRTVIAQPGDTIWAIARRVMPEGNINSLVDQLVKLNGATITVGQSIRIP